ncbi:MAG: hypothetical protein WDN44_12500 [Sphingomonas sp.]
MKIGDPMDAATEMGPLSSVAQRDTVLDQVAKAQAGRRAAAVRRREDRA